MSDSAWQVVLEKQTTEAKKDSTFVFKALFSTVEAGKSVLQFVEDPGVNYKFKIVSRRVDSLSKIDFTPEGAKGANYNGARMSGIKFDQEGSYFSHIFSYARPKNSDAVSIEFDGIDTSNLKRNDLMLFIFKEE